MISRIKSIAEGVKQNTQTGVGHPTGAVSMVITQIAQAGVVGIESRGEEEMNVTIALSVLTLGMWLGNVTLTKTGVVNWETADDYSGGTQNSRQQQ